MIKFDSIHQVPSDIIADMISLFIKHYIFHHEDKFLLSTYCAVILTVSHFFILSGILAESKMIFFFESQAIILFLSVISFYLSLFHSYLILFVYISQ